MTDKFLTIIGPTASGKSKLAIELALKHQGEIVNCDSLQVYKDFNIGTAKPTAEELSQVPHHLIDSVSWWESFDASQYAVLALKTIQEIQGRGKLPIVVGGTGFYLRALLGDKFHDLPQDEEVRKALEKLETPILWERLKQQDPMRANALHPNDRYRILRALEIQTLTGKTFAESTKNPTEQKAPVPILYLNPPRKELHERIAKRITVMLDQGLIDEVKAILESGCPEHAKPMQSIGYKQCVDYLRGQLTERQLPEKILFATRQYAKRQITWFNALARTYHEMEGLHGIEHHFTAQ